MHSAASVLRLWAAFTILILGYAFIDLRVTPELYSEHAITLQPDLSRAADLVHWGGRLLRENAHALLIGNAVVLGGLLALLVNQLLALFRRAGEAQRQSTIPPQA